MTTLGIDIGASKIAFALIRNKRLLRFARHALTQKTTAEVLHILKSDLLRFLEKEAPRDIGLGVPCIIDASGKSRQCVNIPKLHPEVIAAHLHRRFHAPVVIRNDVHMAAYGESLLHGHAHRNFVFLAFGSGIGGAIVINGKIWRGDNGWAGEVGHLTFRDSIWERYASGQFLKGKKGDRQFRVLGENIGEGLANIAFAYAPKNIVIGGGLSAIWKSHLEKPACAVLAKRLRSYGLRIPKITVAELGEEAGAYGAALLAAVHNE